jgi:hypothetical protein
MEPEKVPSQDGLQKIPSAARKKKKKIPRAKTEEQIALELRELELKREEELRKEQEAQRLKEEEEERKRQEEIERQKAAIVYGEPLKEIAQWPVKVEELYLGNKSIDFLKDMEQFPNLKELWLNGNRVRINLQVDFT